MLTLQQIYGILYAIISLVQADMQNLLFIHKKLSERSRHIYENALLRQTGITILCCKFNFNKYDYALGCCGFAAVGGVFDFFRRDLK